MRIKKKNYSDEINIYYYNNLKSGLFKKISPILYGKDFNGKVVKSAEGREVLKLKNEDKIYYIKKYSYRKVSKKIKNLFRAPAAVRAMKTSFKLKQKSIPVVEVEFAATYKLNLHTVDSIFVTRDFGGENLQNFLARGQYDRELKRKIIVKLAYIWALFHNNNFINGDPNLGAVTINFEKDEFDIALVDFDNISHYPILPWKKVRKNLIKFNSHMYIGLYKLNGKKLEIKDRKLFFHKFIKYYNKELNIKKNIDYIFKKTAEKLISWNKEEIIRENPELKHFSK